MPRKPNIKERERILREELYQQKQLNERIGGLHREQLLLLQQEVELSNPVQCEVVKSFSYKFSPQRLGGPAYESFDFFTSAKSFCAISQRERKAEELAAFVKKETLKDFRTHLLTCKGEFYDK